MQNIFLRLLGELRRAINRQGGQAFNPLVNNDEINDEINDIDDNEHSEEDDEESSEIEDDSEEEDGVLPLAVEGALQQGERSTLHRELPMPLTLLSKSLTSAFFQ